MTRRLLVAATSALLLVVAACEPKPSSPSPQDLADVDVSPDHTITVSESGFEPADLTVDAGDVIEVTNAGEQAHTATNPNHFDTGNLEPGESTVIVLTTPGEIEYRDATTPDHMATIHVAAATP